MRSYIPSPIVLRTLLSKNYLSFFLYFIGSFAIVAFGQPGWLYYLAPFAAIIGYAIFWRSLHFFSTKKQRFWVSSAWFAFVQMVQLSWMTATEYQGMYILFVYATVAFALGLQFGILSLLIPEKTHEISFPRILAVSSLWTIMEWSRLHFLCGFSWNPVGIALTSFIPSLQLASVWGIFGLSFWVILSNLSALKCLKKVAHYPIWAGMISFPYFFGMAHIASHKDRNEQEMLSVALVQTALLPSEKVPLYGQKHKFIHPYDQWHRILSFLKEHDQKKIDLIVLPEAAVPFNAYQCVYSLEMVEKILRFELGEEVVLHRPPLQAPFAEAKQINDRQIWMVTNAFWAQYLANYFRADVVSGMDVQDNGPLDNTRNYNAALHFIPFSENVKNRYEKRILLPLAEYLPFNFLKPLVKRYGISEFFTHGKEAKVFPGNVPFSVSICYEETFPSLIREGRIKGADLFVNVTNDNWYPFSKLPLQHFTHGRLRAVENGVPLVRACNTGITAAIDCFGRTISSLGETSSTSFEWTSGALFTSISKHQFKTLYTIWGDFGILGMCLVMLLFFLVWKPRFKW